MSEKPFSRRKKYLFGFIGWVVGAFIVNAVFAWLISNNNLPEIMNGPLGGLVILVAIILGGVFLAQVATELYTDKFQESSETKKPLKGNGFNSYQCPKCRNYLHGSKPPTCPECGSLCKIAP